MKKLIPIILMLGLLGCKERVLNLEETLKFTGQETKVIQHSPELNPEGKDFTVQFKIKYSDCVDADILRKGSTKTASTWYKLEIGTTDRENNISFALKTDKSNYIISTPDNLYNDNKWHRVTARRTGNHQELYVDNKLIGRRKVYGSISNQANLTIGSKDTLDDDFFTGEIKDVEVKVRR